MINYSDYNKYNILNIKTIQKAYRARKAKGPRNLPMNVQKKILNLLPLRNQKSFINVLRNNSGNPLTKNYRKRKFITKKLLNKFVKRVMSTVVIRSQNRYKINNHIDIGRVRIDKNQMKRFGLNLKGNKLIINYDRIDNNYNNYNTSGNYLRSHPFNKSHRGYFLINGLHLYTLNNRKYLGYIPKNISNSLRSRIKM